MSRRTSTPAAAGAARAQANPIPPATAGPGFEPPASPPTRDAQSSQEVVVLRRERAKALLTAVRQLPNRQRTVIMLSHFDGRSTREVSQMTGLSESTVRVHLFRGLRRLRGLVTRS